MKRYLFLFCVLVFSFNSYSQGLYSRAKIWADRDGLETLSNLGVTVDHGHVKENTFIVCDFSSTEIERAKQAGFQVDILIEDVQEYYRSRVNEPTLKNTSCEEYENGYNPTIPSNFALGTYAGYYHYQEYLDILDEMHTLYPNLITERAPVSDTLTHENRPLYFVKISNSPNQSQDKPKVLYTALHHAREPGSLSQTIFFMWYLLENYGTDPEVTYLVDNLEMYFLPMINPDGYIHNETTNPNGGGMHRKNRNPNVGSSNKGVDLNRNYDYEWNTSGVSSNPNDDTYPGTSYFSEPETKNIKKITEQWGIEFAMNAHTYSGLMLYPYGAAINSFAADDSYFNAISAEMVKYSGYVNQKSSSLYPASGDSDDFMYHHHGVFAQTPEINRNDFWAPSTQILGDCIDMLYSNLVMAHSPLIYGVTTNLDESAYIDETSGNFHYSITRLGRRPGNLIVSVEPIAGISNVGSENSYSLDIEESVQGQISYQLEESLQVGDIVKYVLVTDNGLWQHRDTITKIFGGPTLQFVDEANSLEHWEGNWNITDEDYYSPSTSFTDSPHGNYNNSTTNIFSFRDTIDLTEATRAMINFMAEWDIEAGYDYAQFQVSTDFGSNWIPQCGKYTRVGAGVSPWYGGQPEEPLYDGKKNDWVLEEIDLSEYLGEKIMVRFYLKSDVYVNGDGFYFDDFKIYFDNEDPGGEEPSMLYAESLNSFGLFPNPGDKKVNVSFQNVFQGDILILNANGQVVQEIPVNQESKLVNVDVSSLNQGIYFVRVKDKEQYSSVKRLVIIH